MWNEWGELSRVKNELNKLSDLIVGGNVLQSPLDIWGRYDVWREAVKGLESAIREMEEKDGNIGEDLGRDRHQNIRKYGEKERGSFGGAGYYPQAHE